MEKIKIKLKILKSENWAKLLKIEGNTVQYLQHTSIKNLYYYV